MNQDQFYLRYYVGHTGKYGHEFLEFEFRPDGEVGTRPVQEGVLPQQSARWWLLLLASCS